MAKSPKNEIDEELVKNLTRLLEKNNLTEIEYGRDGWHIRVGRGAGVTVSESRRGSLEPDASPGAIPGPEESSAADNPNAITSPMVGVVFTGPDSDSPPFVKPGDSVGVGQRIGLIRFGSRVDVYLPAGTAPRVILGQRTVAGETILGQIGDARVVPGIQQ